MKDNGSTRQMLQEAAADRKTWHELGESPCAIGSEKAEDDG